MKNVVQLTDVMFYNHSRRVTEDEIKKYNLQYLTILGQSKEGKILCVYGKYDRETKKLVDYVNHGSQRDQEGIYEILSVKEFEINDKNSNNFFFSMAKEEGSKKVFGTWPEILATGLSDIKRSSVSRFFVSGYIEMSLTTGRSVEGHKIIFFNTYDIHEDGFEHGNDFYRVIKN